MVHHIKKHIGRYKSIGHLRPSLTQHKLQGITKNNLDHYRTTLFMPSTTHTNIIV